MCATQCDLIAKYSTLLVDAGVTPHVSIAVHRAADAMVCLLSFTRERLNETCWRQPKRLRTENGYTMSGT
eukprot:3165661-Pyramimonas_sp.AAC.1